jgi:hypothetical protein
MPTCDGQLAQAAAVLRNVLQRGVAHTPAGSIQHYKFK